MKQHQLRALVQVADSGTIRAAARAMGSSPAAVTKALRELEEELGATLLQRSYKGVEFTPSGLALLSRTRLALAQLDKAREEIHRLRGGAGARVAVAVTPLACILVMPRVLREYQLVQPDVTLSITDGVVATLIPDLLEGQLDFAVAFADPRQLPYEIDFTPLMVTDVAVACRIGNPLSNARAWSDMAEARWILNVSPGSQSNAFMQWLHERGLDIEPHLVRTNSPLMQLELLRRTDLIGIGPRRLLDDPMFSSGLARIMIDPPPPSIELGLLRLRAAPLSSAARPLANLLSRYLSTH